MPIPNAARHPGLRRSTYAAIVAGALALAVALPATASAAPLTTTNACAWSFDGWWRNQDVTLAATPSVAGLEPGAPVALADASIAARLPDWVAQYGYNLGLLKAGPNALPSRVWVALAADGASPATQVREVTVDASTVVTVDAGGNFVSATPIDVTVPLPTTTWTAGGSGVAAFRQAGPGTLPPLPVGTGGANVTPGGSVFISAALGSGLRLNLDCQPGRITGPANSSQGIAAATAAPFASVPITGTAPLPLPPTGSLRAAGRGVPVPLSCPAGGGTCVGVATLTTANKVVVGNRRRTVELGRRAYQVPAGTRRILTVPLTATGVTVLRGVPSVAVNLGLAPGAAPVRRTLRPGAGPAFAGTPAVAGTAVSARVICPARGGVCRGAAAVAPRAGGAALARGRFAIAAGRSALVRIPLTAAGRRALADGARVRATVTLTPDTAARVATRRALLAG